MAFQRRALSPEEIGMTAGGKVVPVPHLGRWGVVDDYTNMPVGHYSLKDAAELADRAYKYGGFVLKGEREYEDGLDFVSTSKRPVDAIIIGDDSDWTAENVMIETIPGKL